MRTATTTTALAAQLGATRRTVSAWLKRPDSPGRTATGGFNIARWKAYVAASGLGSRTAAADRDPALAAQKRETLRLQSELISLQTRHLALGNQIARGELANEMAVCKVVVDPFSDFIRELKGVKHRVGHIVSGQSAGDAARILSKELTACIARWNLPEVYRNHPFYGKLKAELARLNAELSEEGGV